MTAREALDALEGARNLALFARAAQPQPCCVPSATHRSNPLRERVQPLTPARPVDVAPAARASSLPPEQPTEPPHFRPASRSVVLLLPLLFGLASACGAAPTSPADAAPTSPADADFAPPQPVRHTRVGNWGWLEINDQPVIATLLSKFYAWDFHEKVGLTEDQLWSQVRDAGFLAIQGNWFYEPDGTPNEKKYWDRYGLLFYGSATQDLGRSLDSWTPGKNSPEGRRIIADIVNYHKAKPWLLFWLVANEYNIEAEPFSDYQSVHSYVRTLDPSRLTGDIYVRAGPWNGREVLYGLHGVLLPEISIDSSINADLPFTVLLGELELQERAWANGKRFVRGVSTTPISEFAPGGVHPCGDHRPQPYPRQEFDRWMLSQVIFNARAFEILWGPSQTERGCDPSQTPWGSWAKVMEVWGWTLDFSRAVNTTLRPVILSAGEFRRIPEATPVFRTPSLETNWVYKGIYAARKDVGGVTYIGVINTQTEDLANVVVPVTATATFACDLLTRRTEPVASGALRFSAFPGLTARIYQLGSCP